MKKWLQLIVSFVGSLLALWLASFFNFFDYITFIPADKSYDVCITIYFTLIETVLNIAYSAWIEWWEKEKTQIETVIYLPNEEPNRSGCPVIRFNSMDMAEIKIKLVIKGKCKNIINKNIVLQTMTQADMQIGRRGIGAVIDNNGNFVIKMCQLCQSREEIETEETYKVVLQRGNVEDSSQITMKPILSTGSKNWRVKYISNEAKLILEEK